jgi:hypothetical protein
MSAETALMKMLLYLDVCVRVCVCVYIYIYICVCVCIYIYNRYLYKYKLWRFEHACNSELAGTSPVFTPGYSASYNEHSVYYMYIKCVI